MGGKSSTGIDENVAGLLCYLLGVITGIIFYVIEKESKFVRFHAVQSIIVFGGLAVVNIIIIPVLAVIPILGWIVGVLLSFLLSILSLVLWVLLMYKAYRGEMYKLPVAGSLAERYS